MNASSWPGTSYFLKRRDVAAIVQSPGVAEVAKAVSKKPPQVGWRSSLVWCRNSLELTQTAGLGAVQACLPPGGAYDVFCANEPASAVLSRRDSPSLVLQQPWLQLKPAGSSIPPPTLCISSLCCKLRSPALALPHTGCPPISPQCLQVLVRYALDRGCTICPKATSHDHIKVRHTWRVD